MLAYATLIGTVFSFLSWYPLYLHQQNLSNVSGYISMLFDIGSIVGSFVLGYLYQVEKQTSSASESKSFYTKALTMCLRWKLAIWIMACIFTLGAFVLADNMSIVFYCLLTFFVGIFLSGLAFVISMHEII